MSDRSQHDRDPKGEIPLALIDLLDRLREAIDRLPANIVDALRKGPSGPQGPASGQAARPGPASPGPDAGHSNAQAVALVRPVIARVAKEFADKMGERLERVAARAARASVKASRASTPGTGLMPYQGGLDRIAADPTIYAKVRAAYRGPGALGGGRAGIGGPGGPGGGGGGLGAFGGGPGSFNNPINVGGAGVIYAKVRSPRRQPAMGGGPGKRGRWAGWSAKASAWGRAGAGAAGQAWHNARRGYRAGKRTYNAGKGARAAWKAAGVGLVGRGAAAKITAGGLAASQVTLALGAVIKAGDSLRVFAERVNDSNRYLAPFSGQLSAAFGRLDLGDQRRDLALARAGGGSAANLTDQVNRMRDATSGFQKLKDAVWNRVANIGSKLVTPALKELGDIAGDGADWLEKADPSGKRSGGWVDGLHANAAGAQGWLMRFIGSGGDLAAANKAAEEAMKQVEIDRMAGMVIPNDGWTDFMSQAMNLPALNPPRKWNP